MATDEANWVTVATAAELGPGSVRPVTIRDREIALYNVDGAFYAISDVCTHAYARLSDGFLEGYEIECPLHFGRFDIRTGKGLCEPIVSDLQAYKVRIEAGSVQILCDDAME
ncbi:MAG: naphthalene 1,2-dioxygenase [Proteobacteria bacterium]|nr:MAG: naphthalene 1,2-dioxygenase [Pseudomonadota bacterium]